MGRRRADPLIRITRALEAFCDPDRPGMERPFRCAPPEWLGVGDSAVAATDGHCAVLIDAPLSASAEGPPLARLLHESGAPKGWTLALEAREVAWLRSVAVVADRRATIEVALNGDVTLTRDDDCVHLASLLTEWCPPTAMAPYGFNARYVIDFLSFARLDTADISFTSTARDGSGPWLSTGWRVDGYRAAFVLMPLRLTRG